MKKEYHFSKAKRGAILPATVKTRITAYLDDVVIERFKALSEKTEKGYQTLINEALRAYLEVDESPLTVRRTSLQSFSEPAAATAARSASR